MNGIVLIVLAAAVLAAGGRWVLRRRRQSREEDRRWFTEEQIWWAQLRASVPSLPTPATPSARVTHVGGAGAYRSAWPSARTR